MFTDESIMLLKNVLAVRESPLPIRPERLMALIARLDAAERHIEKHGCPGGSCDTYQAWRKSKGE